MNATAMAQDGPKNKDSRIDDLDAALEESEEQNEENRVVEEADANQGCSCRQRLGSILDGLSIRYTVMEFASLDAIISCISEGVGITLLPKALVKRLWPDQSVTAHNLPADQARVETVFVRRSDRCPTSALNAFLKMSREISNIVTGDRQLEAIE